LGRELQNAAQPEIQKGIQRVDSEVRAAADAFGDRTRKLMNELQQPLEQPRLPADHQPPAASNTAGGEQAWNQEQGAVASTNPLRSGSNDGGSTWNGQNGSAPTPAPPPARGVDPWAGVPDPRKQAGAGAGGAGAQRGVPELATRPLPFGGLGGNPVATGPQFPSVENPGEQPQAPVAHAPGSQADPNSPVVRSDMLQQPADRPLDGTVAQPVATTQNPAAPPTTPAANAWGNTPQTAQPTQAQAASGPASTAANGNGGGAVQASGGNTIAVLVAWVLLSGSIAGNLYLFWSYLDVRQKYRALVRKTARAVGSRFSAA
ncbi:MAG TPA: hypothetical protein VF175_01180, partial [Lacipirellula sp.]